MRTGKYQQKNEKKVFKHAERLNDKIIMWGEMKITEEKIKWNVQVFKVFALGWMIIFKTYSYKTLSQPTLVWYIWICSKSKQNQKTMMKNMTKLVYQEKKIQSMLSEPRTAISLMYIAASSLWRSTIIAVEQAWNYIVRPSVTSVTTAEFYRRSHPEQSSRSNEFCRRSFIKYTPWSVCFLIVMLIKKNKTKKKLASFHEPRFGRCSLNISLSDSISTLENIKAKELTSTYWTISVCELFQIWKFDVFLTLMLWHLIDSFNLIQPIRLFALH